MKNKLKKIILFLLRNIPVKKVTANIACITQNRSLINKVAVVTGGTGGIGYAIAEAFIKSGASVVVTGRNITKLESIKKSLSTKCTQDNKVDILSLDITDITSFDDKIESIIKNLGKIDILVNNAGVIGGDWAKTDEAEYENVMNTNLKGAFFLSRTVAKYMINNHITGNILNICSSSSLRPANSAYTLSKWGIRGLTVGLAKSLIKYGITVNGIAPGPTATAMLNKDKNGSIDNKYSPIGRLALPEEIANMAVFLTSDFGKTIVGDVIYMTGGAGIITYDDVSYNL